MTIQEAVAKLREDIATLELTTSVGVVLDRDWPQRMAAVLDSHERFIAIAEDAAESGTAPIGLRVKAKKALIELDTPIACECESGR